MTACPRFAYIILYNNTTSELVVKHGGYELKIAPKEEGKFRFLWKPYQIEAGARHWLYDHSIPHRGENGPYFDGTLRLQINDNGNIYVLRIGENFPLVLTEDIEQPEGFPLRGKK